MFVPEPKVQSFIIKLWLEEAGDETGRLIWHGYITHVPDGHRHYFRTLDDITDVIARHLEEMGLGPKPKSVVRQWSRSWSHRLKSWFR
jgi:hypothetical protein